MKKVIGMLLSFVFVLGAAGCGNSGGTEREAAKQEETQGSGYSDLMGKEFENDDIYIKIENTEQLVGLDDEWEQAYGQLIADQDIPIYCDGGFVVGNIKAGATIDITEHGITQDGNPSAFYRFPNPISEVPFDYLYVSYLDCNYENFNVETDSSRIEAAEWEQQKQEEADAPYVEIYEKAGYDKDKEYTIDEYMEILTKICEELGKENNIELAQMSPFDSYDGFRIETTVGITEFTEETTKRLMNYMECGRDGWGGITEFCIVKAKSDDGEESVMIFTKLDNEVIEKNMKEWQ